MQCFLSRNVMHKPLAPKSRSISTKSHLQLEGIGPLIRVIIATSYADTRN